MDPRFRPKRENFTLVPIWIKIHDLPLVCWNFEGIFRIASKVGIPLAVDVLAAHRTRLTFARVCMQVSNSATYPKEILISLDGEVCNLKVQYEWRPSPCEFCSSLAHLSSLCPSKLNNPENPSGPTNNSSYRATSSRGRSLTKKPKGRKHSANPGNYNNLQQPCQQQASHQQAVQSHNHRDTPSTSNNTLDQNPTDPSAGTNAENLSQVWQGNLPSATTPFIEVPADSFSDKDPIFSSILNLNSPTDEANGPPPMSQLPGLVAPDGVLSPNKREEKEKKMRKETNLRLGGGRNGSAGADRALGSDSTREVEQGCQGSLAAVAWERAGGGFVWAGSEERTTEVGVFWPRVFEQEGSNESQTEWEVRASACWGFRLVFTRERSSSGVG
ncbi:hypothetical protein M5K25_011046 [Dendrobium thyrsiflorum]|uniref:DUF4283 domain-containing protein n=1 Tax=Dendrobium thyrsiflorum TaxID=117978 RepID=A0ABD0V8Q8_DENTH